MQNDIKRIVHELFDVSIVPQVSVPEEQFGDLATNIAMQLAGILDSKIFNGPREIAEQIAEKMRELPHVDEATVAGPGFLNIKLTDNYLLEQLQKETPKPLTGQKIVVEYSDPNPFKPLHAGHLYTTLVGDVLARLVENAGAETIRLNFGGDVGRHVAITMWSVIKFFGSENVNAVKEIPTDSLGIWMGERYVEGTNAFEQNDQVKLEITSMNKRVYQLHSENDHESDFAQIYWYLRDKSYDFFKHLYSELQVSAFDRFIPESEVAELGLKTVKDHVGGVFSESEGAIVFQGETFGLHTRVFINKEGLPTYEAKDVGLSLTKWQDYHFDESIIITANEISQYMQVVLKAIEQFSPDLAQKTKHLTHGFVKLAGGVKMSSRKGNILSAFDILQAARNAGQVSGQAVQEEVVLASVKYSFLKNKIGGDIIYDPEESIATEGNSGPYLQYAHARAQSILSKSQVSEVSEVNFLTTQNLSLETGERTLVRKIVEFNDVVEKATIELAPHIICTFLYELAQEFNRFYENNKVIGDVRQDIRLSLVLKYAETLKNGLNLLGIQAPNHM